MSETAPISNPPSSATPPPARSTTGLQILLGYEALHRLALWTAALAGALLFARWIGWIPWQRLVLSAGYGQVFRAALELAGIVLAFNIVYLLLLVVCRLVLRRPPPGRYALTSRRPSRAIIDSALLGILTRERFHPIFPAFLVPMLANIPPFHRLLAVTIGPDSHSPMFVEPHLLDPWGIRIGRNVVIGFGTTIAAHLQHGDAIEFAPVIVEDNVVIGAHCTIPGGSHIKRGAFLRATSVLVPGTVIGEGETWGGAPARRMRRANDAVEPQAG